MRWCLLCLLLLAGCSQAVRSPAEHAAVRIRQLIVELGDRSDDVRLAARFELMRRGKSAEPDLLAALSHRDPVVRYEASAALSGMVGVLGEEARQPLEWATSDADQRVRANAVQILGRLGHGQEQS